MLSAKLCRKSAVFLATYITVFLLRFKKIGLHMQHPVVAVATKYLFLPPQNYGFGLRLGAKQVCKRGAGGYTVKKG
jgi:hypothetical protein